MADFSHLRLQRPDQVARYISRGKQPSDEMLLEAFEVISPPLVPDRYADAIIRILSRKRGRPSKAEPTRQKLSDRIRNVRRKNVPRIYLEALAERICSGKGITEFQRALPSHRKISRLKLKNLMHGLYHDFYALLDGQPKIDHPVLGRMAVPVEEKSRSERAVKMAQDWLEEHAFYPPSTRTMMNIISSMSKKPRRFS